MRNALLINPAKRSQGLEVRQNPLVDALRQVILTAGLFAVALEVVLRLDQVVEVRCSKGHIRDGVVKVELVVWVKLDSQSMRGNAGS